MDELNRRWRGVNQRGAMSKLDETVQAIRKMHSDIDVDAVLDQIEEFQEAIANGSRPSSPPPGEEERDQLYAALRQEARTDPERFGKVVASIQPSSDDCLFELYEALVPDAALWRDLYLSELRRLLDLSAASDRECRDLVRHALLPMCLAMEKDGKLWSASREMLVELVADPEPMRRFALLLLGDLAPDGDSESIALFEREASARDWRGRYVARLSYNDLTNKPLQHGIPFMDRLRARFSNPTRTP